MRLHFHAGADVSELDLVPGRWTVGGGVNDGLRIGGLAPAVLHLAVTPAAVWVEGTRRLWVGPGPLDAGTWRLLLPGEAVELPPAGCLRLPPTRPAGTRALFRAFAEGQWPLPPCAAPVLVAVAGPDAGESFPLGPGTDELGRLEHCAIRLRDPAVSRRQLRLVRAPGGIRVELLPARNPVRHNGRRVRGRTLLRAGDLLGVGRTLLCYLPGTPEAGSPPEEPGVSHVNGDATQRRARPGLSAGGTARRAPPAAPSAGGAG